MLATAVVLLVACRAAPPEGDPAPTVRVAIAGEPLTLDPHLQDDAITHAVLWNAYEGLTAFDAEMRIEPALAVRWESVDDHTWRFPLRPGVRFHDGRPLGAADVVASLERARDHPESRTSGYLVGVDAVRAVDAETVEIRTRQPTPLLLNKLAFVAILPAADAGVAPLDRVVGSGPYRLTRTAGGVRLAAFADHWRGPPPIARFDLVVLEDGRERGRRLLAGELDVVIRLDPADAVAVAASPRHHLVGRPSLSVFYVGLRCDRPPFADPRVRRAVDLALDRDELVRELRQGFGEPRGQMVDRNVFGYDPEIAVPERDLDTARRLLAEAGYPDGFAVDIEHRAGLDLGVLGHQLAAIGIRGRSRPLPWSELLPRLRSGAVTFYVGGLLCPTGDASDLLDDVVHSPQPERGYGRGNVFGYSDPATDRLIEAAATALDMAERLPLLQAAVRRLAAERPMVPLYTPRHLHGLAAGLEWSPRTDGFFRAWELRRAAAAADAPGDDPEAQSTAR